MYWILSNIFASPSHYQLPASLEEEETFWIRALAGFSEMPNNFTLTSPSFIIQSIIHDPRYSQVLTCISLIALQQDLWWYKRGEWGNNNNNSVWVDATFVIIYIRRRRVAVCDFGHLVLGAEICIKLKVTASYKLLGVVWCCALSCDFSMSVGCGHYFCSDTLPCLKCEECCILSILGKCGDFYICTIG